MTRTVKALGSGGYAQAERERGGKSRGPTKARDHDVQPDEKVTPVGILMPSPDERFVSGSTSKLTHACLMDRLAQWWDEVRPRFAPITTLRITLDNGPKTHRRRTPFMRRRIDFVQATGLPVHVAYYSPYHSKYNPVERCWGMRNDRSSDNDSGRFGLKVSEPCNGKRCVGAGGARASRPRTRGEGGTPALPDSLSESL